MECDIGFYKDKLLIGIAITLLLLIVCVGVDYADDNIITNIHNGTVDNAIMPNNTSVIGVNESAHLIVVKNTDKLYHDNGVIGMWAKPSCGCRYSYTWHYREFINYCPNCHYYGNLRKNPKGVYEKEYTCSRCSSDFCGVCGKEKYSWSKVYLRKA